MKVNHFFIIFTIFILLSACDNKISNQNQKEGNASTSNKENPLHYSINELEKIDRTVKEKRNIPVYYENENGAILSAAGSNDTIKYIRRFIFQFEINQYCYPTIRQLYKSHNFSEKLNTLQDNSIIRCSKILVLTNNECWINIEDQSRNNGWIFLGLQDPYEDDNWAVIGSMEMDGETVLLRKYTGWFSVGKNQPAYDRPSLKGNILWTSERTDDNAQVNLKAICVTNNTYKSQQLLEHWVKVKDSYERIGWMPGNVLDVDRGGPKYLSPENRVRRSIYEP